jgi:phosphate acetyltransferase
MASFFDAVIQRASESIKTIVLPEGNDDRTLEAAADILTRKFAKLVILGDVPTLEKKLRGYGADPSKLQLINPKTDARLESYAQVFYEQRKHKGVTLEQARTTVQDEVYFGTMMLKTGEADGMVAGACHSTGDTLRPALQIIKPAAGVSTVSSMFFMCFPDKVLMYADCGLIEDPTEKQLVDIAISTAKTALQFGFEARVAMLSYSTKGSASGPNAVKMAIASEKAKEAAKNIFGDKVILDGELQFDAAYVPSVAAKKAPGSPLQGNANIFIFPDLGAGNLCYKSTQRLAGAEAFGPIVQGLAKPVNDLSRGCSVLDIVAAVAITAIQANA